MRLFNFFEQQELLADKQKALDNDTKRIGAIADLNTKVRRLERQRAALITVGIGFIIIFFFLPSPKQQPDDAKPSTAPETQVKPNDMSHSADVGKLPNMEAKPSAEHTQQRNSETPGPDTSWNRFIPADAPRPRK